MASTQALEQGPTILPEQQSRPVVDRSGATPFHQPTRRDLSLIGMPSEILRMIGDELEHDDSALAAMALTCRRFNQVFEPLLYRHNVKCGRHRGPPCQSLIWGASRNRVGTMAKAIKAMESYDGVNLDRYGPDLIEVDFMHILDFSAGTALHWAARNGNDEAVEFLVQRGADLRSPAINLCRCQPDRLPKPREWTPDDEEESENEENYGSGWFPLHLAICNGHTSTAELLMSYGAPCQMCIRRPGSISDFESDSNSSHSGSEDPQSAVISAIHSAAVCGQPVLFESMVQKAAYSHGDWATHSLLEGSADIVNRWSQFGYPLHFAVCSRLRVRETITALVQLGADVNLTRHDLPPPLFLAVERGDWDAADTLLDLGASTELPHGMDQQKPLLFRAIYSKDHNEAPRLGKHEQPWNNGRDNIIRRLVGLGLNLNESNDWLGYTALTWCANTTSSSDSMRGVIPLLLQLGADINEVDEEGNMVLHSLVESMSGVYDNLWEHSRELIGFVLEHGASESLLLENAVGSTPVDLLIDGLPYLRPRAKNWWIQILVKFLRYRDFLGELEIEAICNAMEETSVELEDSVRD